MEELLIVWLTGLIPWALALVVVMLLDFIGGASLAYIEKRFRFEELPNFLITGVLFGWAWLTAEMIFFMPVLLGIEIVGYQELFAEYAPKAVLTFVIITKYGSSIVGHIKAILALQQWSRLNEMPF